QGPTWRAFEAPLLNHRRVALLRTLSDPAYRVTDGATPTRPGRCTVADVTPAEAIRVVCDAWSRLDNDAIAAAFAEDGLFEDPLHERQLAGRDDIRVTNAAAVAGLRECQVTLRHLLEDGRLGFAEGRFEAVDVDGNRMDFPKPSRPS